MKSEECDPSSSSDLSSTAELSPLTYKEGEGIDREGGGGGVAVGGGAGVGVGVSAGASDNSSESDESNGCVDKNDDGDGVDYNYLSPCESEGVGRRRRGRGGNNYCSPPDNLMVLSPRSAAAARARHRAAPQSSTKWDDDDHDDDDNHDDEDDNDVDVDDVDVERHGRRTDRAHSATYKERKKKLIRHHDNYRHHRRVWSFGSTPTDGAAGGDEMSLCGRDGYRLDDKKKKKKKRFASKMNHGDWFSSSSSSSSTSSSSFFFSLSHGRLKSGRKSTHSGVAAAVVLTSIVWTSTFLFVLYGSAGKTFWAGTTFGTRTGDHGSTDWGGGGGNDRGSGSGSDDDAPGMYFFNSHSAAERARAIHARAVKTTPPRIVLLQSKSMWRPSHEVTVHDPILKVNPGEEAPPQLERQPYVQGNCVPMKEWQVTSLPNCNTVHELDVVATGKNLTVRFPRGGGGDDGSVYQFTEDSIIQLARGWFRHTWRVNTGSVQESFVLKTLRLEREFYDEYYDLHRRDAMAMERLTRSPFVMDIYGYCGQSAINELADFLDGFTNLQVFAKQLRGRNDPDVTRMKLQISAMLALGVAHMHEIDGDGNNATMVHYDVNPKNVAIVKGGRPKLNDFNVAEFMRWDVVKNKRCGFKGRLHEPWWRAPEELVMLVPKDRETMITEEGYVESPDQLPDLTEKVDVYSLGNLIYYMLTGHSPRGQTVKSRLADVRKAVLRGEPPVVDDYYLSSKDPAIVAMRRAVRRCYESRPEERWSAGDIADELMQVLIKLKSEKSS